MSCKLDQFTVPSGGSVECVDSDKNKYSQTYPLTPLSYCHTATENDTSLGTGQLGGNKIK